MAFPRGSWGSGAYGSGPWGGSPPTTVAQLGVNVCDRVEEPSDPVFWTLTTEVYSGIVEAMNDLLLLVGRPDLAVNVPYTLLPNTVWQTLPPGAFLITDVQGAASQLWKVSLHDMDYTQSSWGSDWENDVADVPKRWFPVGMGVFGIHPAVSTPTQVNLTTISTPVTDVWPYTGLETIPFHSEFFEAIEIYAAHYLRFKEMGSEADEGKMLYDSFLKIAQRMTTIEDRRDPNIFAKTIGAPAGLNPFTKR